MFLFVFVKFLLMKLISNIWRCFLHLNEVQRFLFLFTKTTRNIL